MMIYQFGKDFLLINNACVRFPVYGRIPVTRTLKGNEKQFELSGSIENPTCQVNNWYSIQYSAN